MSTEITVIYNETCPICAREIAAYRRYAEARDLPIRFADLSSEIPARQGLTPDDAARRLHVVQDGTVLRGTEAFLALWAAMPRFRFLARVLALPGLKQAVNVVYEGILAPALYALHKRRVRRSCAL